MQLFRSGLAKVFRAFAPRQSLHKAAQFPHPQSHPGRQLGRVLGAIQDIRESRWAPKGIAELSCATSVGFVKAQLVLASRA